MEIRRAVVAIVENDGKIILGKKRSDSKSILSGQWHIPGETVEENETDEQAIIRGLQEEAGIPVNVVKFIGSHQTPKGMIINWYLCRTDHVELLVGSDLEDIMWVEKSEVSNLNSEIAKVLWPDEVSEMFQK